jgi:hypothetical protein
MWPCLIACWILGFWPAPVFIYLFLEVLGFKLRAYTLSQSFCVLGIFEIGFHKLFAQAGFKL